MIINQLCKLAAVQAKLQLVNASSSNTCSVFTHVFIHDEVKEIISKETLFEFFISSFCSAFMRFTCSVDVSVTDLHHVHGDSVSHKHKTVNFISALN